MSIVSFSELPAQPNNIVETPRILIIEDNLMIRNLYHRSLVSAGFAVKVAADSTQASDLLTNFKPCIVMLDLDLPNAASDALLASMSASESKPPTLIGFSERTSSASLSIGQTAYFLRKPVSLGTLIDLVRRICTDHSATS